MRILSKPGVEPVLESLGGTAHTRDLLAAGLHPRALYAARDTGAVVEVSRGVYRLATLPLTEPDLVAVALRMPRAVICTVSALHLHGLTVEIPRAVHVALPRGTHPARLAHPPLEVYHLSDAAWQAGIEERVVDGVTLRVSSVAKAIADAFRFRQRVGQDTALDALKRALRRGVATPAEIDRMAQIDRVGVIVRPLLAALT